MSSHLIFTPKNVKLQFGGGVQMSQESSLKLSLGWSSHGSWRWTRKAEGCGRGIKSPFWEGEVLGLGPKMGFSPKEASK